MSVGSLAIDVLLATSVAAALLSCLGIAVMKSQYDRLHFMAPVSTICVTGVLMAVVVQDGWGQAAIKTSLILLALVLTNPVLAHATARAARVRDLGQWQPAQGEKIEGLDQIARGRKTKE